MTICLGSRSSTGLSYDREKKRVVGLEPTYSCLEGRGTTFVPHPQMVGAAGFEPTISCPPDRRDNQASLRPDVRYTMVGVEGFEPPITCFQSRWLGR